jgi:hypothetical protein
MDVPHIQAHLSSVPSVFVSVQFCAQKNIEKVFLFLCAEKVFLWIFPHRKAHRKTRRNTDGKIPPPGISIHHA